MNTPLILLAAALLGSSPVEADTPCDLSAASDAGQLAPPCEQAPVQETVVTGTRPARPRRDVPATIDVIPREEIERSPALVTDDLVRILPSVGLFRRSSSLAADPSSQGLNLRGLGPSAVSRALVLLDGVPVNDAFGGWVYWRGLPRLGIERVEVMPGGGSALYGNQALGGVMYLVSRPIRSDSVEAELGVGEFETFHGAARGAFRSGNVGVAVEAEALSTAGFEVVAPHDSGSVDGRAPSRHAAVNARVEFRPMDRLDLTARVSHFEEAQSGGTRFTTAALRTTNAAVHGQFDLRSAGRLAGALFGRVGRFDQVRARIAADRNTEVIARSQQVPSTDMGVGLLWLAPELEALGRHQPSIGADVRAVSGESQERLFPPGDAPSSAVQRFAGGTQQFAGVFAEDVYTPTPQWTVSAALRLDAWRDLGGSLRVTRRDESATEERFDDRTETSLNPRVGVLFRPIDALAFRASGWRAFRAPTLNELYRPFQVGRIYTAANAALRPETVWGGEVGTEVEPFSGSTVRVTGFWNEVMDPVSNVTLPDSEDGTARQRQNLGRAQVRGVELAASSRLARRWVVNAAYTFVDARVAEAPAQPSLVGKQLPQDPNHRGTLGIRFDDPDIGALSLQARWTGPQFEDDLNERPMAGYVLVDALVSRRLVGPLEVFAAVENLFDREYLVGRAGVDTVGQPFSIRAGLRLQLM